MLKGQRLFVLRTYLPYTLAERVETPLDLTSQINTYFTDFTWSPLSDTSSWLFTSLIHPIKIQGKMFQALFSSTSPTTNTMASPSKCLKRRIPKCSLLGNSRYQQSGIGCLSCARHRCWWRCCLLGLMYYKPSSIFLEEKVSTEREATMIHATQLATTSSK